MKKKYIYGDGGRVCVGRPGGVRETLHEAGHTGQERKQRSTENRASSQETLWVCYKHTPHTHTACRIPPQLISSSLSLPLLVLPAP